MHKRCFLTTGKTQVDRGLISIRDIVPDTFMLDAMDAHDRIWYQVKNPIQVMRAPIVIDTTRNRLMGMPIIAGMAIATNKRLDVKGRTNQALLKYLSNSQV